MRQRFLVQYHLIFIPVLLCVSNKFEPKCGILTYRIWSWGLWSTSLSGNNDLVNRKHCPRGFSCKLDGPALRDHQIQDTLILCIKSTSVVLVLEMSVFVLRRVKSACLPRCQHQQSIHHLSCDGQCTTYSKPRWHPGPHSRPTFLG